MHRLEQARTVAAKGGRWKHADRAGEHGGLIAEDVSEQVPREQHVELAWTAHQLHRGVVHIHVADLHIAVGGGHRIHPVPPQLAHIQHVGLVHGAEVAATFPGQVEGHLGNAIHLAGGVGHRVEATLFSVGLDPSLGLPEVDPAGEFPHHHQVHTLDHLRTQAAGTDERRNDLHRAQVGEQGHA